MKGMDEPLSRIDRLVEGEPLRVGTWTLRPRARLSGRHLALPIGELGTLRLSPEAVEVQRDDGEPIALSLAAGPDATRGMLRSAMAVAAVCALIGIAARRR
jgi:hypothetical protein